MSSTALVLQTIFLKLLRVNAGAGEISAEVGSSKREVGNLGSGLVPRLDAGMRGGQQWNGAG